MNDSQNISSKRTSRGSGRSQASAFTLMEMMVSIAILVVIMLAVGVIFKSASASVGISESTLEMTANVQAVERQLERDVAGMDKSSFLVIRSRYDAASHRRFDQMSFMAYGTFPNRCGSYNSTSNFTDSTVATFAHVWWGQLAIEQQTSTMANSITPPSQITPLPLNAPPSGSVDNDFILGRHTTLIFGPDRKTTTGIVDPSGYPSSVGTVGVAAFRNSQVANGPLAISYNTATILPAGIGETTGAHITSSRFDCASVTQSQIMNSIFFNRAGFPFYEAQNYCYRFKALTTPYDSTDEPKGGFINGFFRMHPIALQGVYYLSIQWTDGTSNASGLVWYGIPDNSTNTPTLSPATRQDGTTFQSTTLNSDDYTAQFSYDNRISWPKALKIHYRVADPNNRLQGGRDFVQIIFLPS